jgi:hypothetical protein
MESNPHCQHNGPHYPLKQLISIVVNMLLRAQRFLQTLKLLGGDGLARGNSGPSPHFHQCSTFCAWSAMF